MFLKLRMLTSLAFTKFVVESFGVWSPEAKKFTQNIAQIVKIKTGEFRSKAFFVKIISLEIQTG